MSMQGHTPHGHVQLLAERVHDAHAHAVQAARHAVAAAVAAELAAGVQHRQHRLQRALARRRVRRRRDAAAVVRDGDPPGCQIKLHLSLAAAAAMLFYPAREWEPRNSKRRDTCDMCKCFF